jgi:hypothetical protein
MTIDHWIAVSDHLHNMTTDLAHWRGQFWLVHAASPWHMASSASRIVVWRSTDARLWQRAAGLQIANADIRDPKLAVIGDRLVLYVLRNDGLVAEPSGTAYTISDDGEHWAPLRACGPDGWLLWRPKIGGDGRWYVPAYWRNHGRSILLTSEDGARWTEVSRIHDGDHNDETDLEFLPDGRAVVTARLEVSANLFGDERACTLIAVAEPPYVQWSTVRSATTRLDGPNLFRHDNAIYAVGRRHRRTRAFYNRRAGMFGRKRTALYRVEPDGLHHLLDLPSAGDTGYAGVVVRGDELTVSYYTNDPTTDPTWLVGMAIPTQIRIARMSLAALSRIAQQL